MAAIDSVELELVPGRDCGPCRLCCKVLEVPDVPSKAMQWCAHVTDSGCGIYEDRPGPCKSFFCGWRRNANLPEAWRPDRAGFVISDPEPWAMLITVDPERPESWREDAYHRTIMQWSKACAEQDLVAGVQLPDEAILLIGEAELPMVAFQQSARSRKQQASGRSDD